MWESRWGRAVVVALSTLMLGGAVAIVLTVLRTSGLGPAADVGQIIGVILAVPGLAVPLWLWYRTVPSRPAGPEEVGGARDGLAARVSAQWQHEAVIRRLDDPDPMPVLWRTRVDVMDHLANVGIGSRWFPASSAEIERIAREFRRLRRKRLIILGGAGSGKTTLAVQLVRELLATRAESDAVPVLLSAASWDVAKHPRFQDWITDRLIHDHPSLSSAEAGSQVPRALVAAGAILPVVDGLDEVPDATRADMIEALNRSLGDRDQLILTSRSEEYALAVESHDAITAAAVIEAQPISPEVAADYLDLCLPPFRRPLWEAVLTELRAGAENAIALARVCSTPLGLWMVRTVYATSDANPAELLGARRFADAEALRGHLLDAVIPALISTRYAGDAGSEMFQPRGRHDPERTIRWLGYLAHYLDNVPLGGGRKGTRDFIWWHFARNTLSDRAARTVRQKVDYAIARVLFFCGAGLLVSLMLRLVGELTRAPYWSHVVSGLWADGVPVVIGGIVVGLLAGKGLDRAFATWSLEDPGTASYSISGRWRSLVELVGQRIFTSFRYGAVAGILFFVVSQPVRASSMSGLTELAPLMAIFALALGVPLGLAEGYIGWIELPASTSTSATPTGSWRTDRNLNLTRILLSGVAASSASALTILPILALSRQSRLANDAFSGLYSAGYPRVLFFTFTVGAVIGLISGRRRAALVFAIASLRKAWDGLLPFRLMAFLNDAHRLGLLRSVGPIYQFRHAEFQSHLAARHRAGSGS